MTALTPRFWRCRRLRLATTCDLKVPISADDLAMENCWRMMPVAPTCDPRWFIVDSSDDKRTTWAIPDDDAGAP
jgi:hypothetical protein